MELTSISIRVNSVLLNMYIDSMLIVIPVGCTRISLQSIYRNCKNLYCTTIRVLLYGTLLFNILCTVLLLYRYSITSKLIYVYCNCSNAITPQSLLVECLFIFLVSSTSTVRCMQRLYVH